MKTRPSRIGKWLGKFAEQHSNSSTSGTTPSSGPTAGAAPPSSAMITTSNEIIGLKAIAGSM